MLLIKNAAVHSGVEPAFSGSVLIDHGKILSILHEDELDAFLQEANQEPLEILDAQGRHLLPGLIDIHLHGSYGYDFIRNPREALHHVGSRLCEEGTTSFLASLTVISHEEMLSLLKEYAAALDEEAAFQSLPKAHCLGIHSEGPYLSQAFKALMDPLYLRDPDVQEVEQMKEAANGWLKVMTIAPERAGSPELIENDADLAFMIGHSAASCSQALSGLQAGAKGFTHLYNAMSQHEHRSPGCVTAAFLDDAALCELIADGFHVHPDIVRMTWKVLGPNRLVLITDAMPGKGMADGEYLFSNLGCIKKGNTVRVKETGRIAGSAITMLDAVQNMMDFCNASLDDIVRMACINPACIAGISDHKGTIAKGMDADLILLELNQDNRLHLVRTFVDGICAFSDDGSHALC